MQLDHLIYGTFPDLPGSQQVVYKSTGIDAALEQWLIAFYNEFGDCRSEDFKSSLTVRWYGGTENPLCTVTKVSQFGHDFSGRWGALLRHTAILTETQFRELGGNIHAVAAQLVNSGTSEELSQERTLEIDPASATAALPKLLADIQLDNYLALLRELLRGNRLILYGDINTEISDRYLRNLTSLIPLAWRPCFDWSEFVFRPTEYLDLFIAFNSRYESPTRAIMPFQPEAPNRFSEAGVEPDRIHEFLAALKTAFGACDLAAAADLLQA